MILLLFYEIHVCASLCASYFFLLNCLPSRMHMSEHDLLRTPPTTTTTTCLKIHHFHRFVSLLRSEADDRDQVVEGVNILTGLVSQVCMCKSLSVCICVCVCVCLCPYVCVSMSVCLCLFASVPGCLCVCACVCVCFWVFECPPVCTCVYTLVYLCMHFHSLFARIAILLCCPFSLFPSPSSTHRPNYPLKSI